jgi:hypothetical protein
MPEEKISRKPKDEPMKREQYGCKIINTQIFRDSLKQEHLVVTVKFTATGNEVKRVVLFPGWETRAAIVEPRDAQIVLDAIKFSDEEDEKLADVVVDEVQ